jgi:RimJ/RimL family protein N-acetyltransferase
MAGRYCRVEPLTTAHADDLWDANALDRDGSNFTYLSTDPSESREAYAAWVAQVCEADDPMFFAIIVDGRAAGVASYMRITPAAGTIEVGHINYSPRLQRTRAATEAMYIMMRRAFELGYRRYEWKCDALNAPSRAAAERLGFVYEGLFRQALVYKGRNRDTAWYSVIDREWPGVRTAFERWLDSSNFDEVGRQRASLSQLRATLDRPSTVP